MIPFVMIVLDELGNGSPKRPFTDENQPVEAGFLKLGIPLTQVAPISCGAAVAGAARV